MLQGCEFFLKEMFQPEQALNKAGQGLRPNGVKCLVQPGSSWQT
jgi:hypothetical protein